MAGVFFWFFFGQAKKNKSPPQALCASTKTELRNQDSIGTTTFSFTHLSTNVQGSTFKVQGR